MSEIVLGADSGFQDNRRADSDGRNWKDGKDDPFGSGEERIEPEEEDIIIRNAFEPVPHFSGREAIMALLGFLIDGSGFFELNLKLFGAAMGTLHGLLCGFDDFGDDLFGKLFAGVLVLGSEGLELQHFFRRE
jgi:hypothetical protein